MGLKKPKIARSANIVKEAVVFGDVEIKEGASVLFYSVIRGDRSKIIVGKYSNNQDNCTLHSDPEYPLTVGDYVTVAHNATLHGCTIGDGSLVGMGAIVLNGAQIGKECLIGAGSLILQGQVIPDRSLVMGSPAKVKRQLSEEEVKELYESSQAYCKIGEQLKEEGYIRELD